MKLWKSKAEMRSRGGGRGRHKFCAVHPGRGRGAALGALEHGEARLQALHAVHAGKLKGSISKLTLIFRFSLPLWEWFFY